MSTDPFWSDEAIQRADEAMKSAPRGESALAVLKSIQPDVEALLDLNHRLATRLASAAQQLEESKKAIMRHTLTEAMRRMPSAKAVAVIELMIEETYE